MQHSLLFLLLLPTLAFSCTPVGERCHGSCTFTYRSLQTNLTGIPCDPGCRAQRCRNRCREGSFCHGRLTCTPRCAFVHLPRRNPNYTMVRCWCIPGGSCDRCDCKRHRLEFPWEAEGFTPYGEVIERALE